MKQYIFFNPVYILLGSVVVDTKLPNLEIYAPAAEQVV